MKRKKEKITKISFIWMSFYQRRIYFYTKENKKIKSY